MPIGLRVFYYESSHDEIKGPYPAFISSFDKENQIANLRVFMEDSFSLFDMKNVPQYSSGSRQLRFWSQQEIFSMNRFEKINSLFDVQDLDNTASRVQSKNIPNIYGAFLKLLNENGVGDTEMYIQPDVEITIRQV